MLTSTIKNYIEKGKRRPTAHNVDSLAVELEVNPYWLVFGKAKVPDWNAETNEAQ